MFSIKSSYEKFLNSNLSLKDILSLELTKIDRERFLKLKSKVENNANNRLETVDYFVECFGNLKSNTNMLFISDAYLKANNHEKALEWALKALETSPHWDIYSIARIFANIACILLAKGNFIEALEWGDKGILYNPFEPSLVGVLCEASYTAGEMEKAQGYYEWLKDSGFSPTYWGNFKPIDNIESEMYEPKIIKNSRLKLEDIYEMVACQYFLTDRSDEEKRINHALCLASFGKPKPAFYAVHWAFGLSKSELKIQSFEIFEALKENMSRRDIRTIISNSGIYSYCVEERIASMKELKGRNRDIILYDLVIDPSLEVSIRACELLLELGCRENLAQYLDILNEIQNLTGKTLNRDCDISIMAKIAKKPPIKERGASLIDRIFDEFRQGNLEIDYKPNNPVHSDLLEKLKFSNRKPLPPSLLRLLKFDSNWFLNRFNGIYDPIRYEFQTTTISGALWKYSSNSGHLLEETSDIPEIDGECIVLDTEDEWITVLFIEYTDDNGEYPVLKARLNSNKPEIYLLACGFDVFLALEFGLISSPYFELKKDTENSINKLAEFIGKYNAQTNTYNTDSIKVWDTSKDAPKHQKNKTQNIKSQTTNNYNHSAQTSTTYFNNSDEHFASQNEQISENFNTFSISTEPSKNTIEIKNDNVEVNNTMPEKNIEQKNIDISNNNSSVSDSDKEEENYFNCMIKGMFDEPENNNNNNNNDDVVANKSSFNLQSSEELKNEDFSGINNNQYFDYQDKSCIYPEDSITDNINNNDFEDFEISLEIDDQDEIQIPKDEEIDLEILNTPDKIDINSDDNSFPKKDEKFDFTDFSLDEISFNTDNNNQAELNIDAWNDIGNIFKEENSTPIESDEIVLDFESTISDSGFDNFPGLTSTFKPTDISADATDTNEEELMKTLLDGIEKNDEACFSNTIEILLRKYQYNNEWKDKALYSAVSYNREEFVRILLNIGANPNCSFNGKTALRLACYSNNLQIAKLLVDFGADVNLKDEEGISVLTDSCDEKNVELVGFLLENGAIIGPLDIIYASDIYDSNPENYYKQAVEICKLLLEYGADINQTGDNNVTALFNAIDSNNIELVQLLVNSGIDVNICNWSNDNALQYAWKNNKTDIYKILLNTEARKDIINDEGWCLNDVVDETGLLPRILNIRLYSSQNQQKLKFRIKALFTNNDEPGNEVIKAVKFLEAMAFYGVAGSGVYPPSETFARWFGPVNIENSESTSNIVELSGEYLVRAISENGFSIFIKNIFCQNFKVMELEIISEQVENAILVIDNDKAKNLILGNIDLNYDMWNNLTFNLSEYYIPNRICSFKIRPNINFDLEYVYKIGSFINAVLKIFNNSNKSFNSSENEVVLELPQKIENEVFFGFSSVTGLNETEFTYDKRITKALYINTLLKLNGDTGYIYEFQWNAGK